MPASHEHFEHEDKHESHAKSQAGHRVAPQSG